MIKETETIESTVNDQLLENPILPSLPKNIASVEKTTKVYSHSKSIVTFWKLNWKNF